MADFTPLEKLLLSKINILTDEERDQIQPGSYMVSPFLVLVSGSLKVAKNGSKASTCSIPLIPAIALALHRMGVQRDAFMATLQQAMVEVLNNNVVLEQALAAEPGMAEMAARFQREVVEQLPRTPTRGAVSAVVEVKKPGGSSSVR